MSDILDYLPKHDASMANQSIPQLGRSNVVRASLDALNTVEYAKMNRILKEEYDKKQASILDKPLGEILTNTVNFFGNSYNSYSDKYLEAKFSTPTSATCSTTTTSSSVASS